MKTLKVVRYWVNKSVPPKTTPAFERRKWHGCCAVVSCIAVWLAGPGLARSSEAVPAPPGGLTNYVQTIPGSTVTFEMVAIPGGSICVGSPTSDPGRGTNELPVRQVTIQPFWMGRYEVSWAEYLPFVFMDRREVVRDVDKLEGIIDKDGISHPTKPYGSVYRERGQKGYPALGMGLPAAMEYCRWLSKKTGIRFRLPTEDEWEYACRAGSTNAFFWGNDPKLARDYGWYLETSFVKEYDKETTYPQGKLKPNAWGLSDIVGNLAEWCMSSNLQGPHVARGGAFSESVASLRCAARMIETPEWNELDPQSPQSIWWLASADFVGFRIVRTFGEPIEADQWAAKSAAAVLPPETPSAAGAVAAVEDTPAVYKRLCANCHGPTGKGDTDLGRRHKARDYSSAEVKQSLDDARMLKAIKEGLAVDGKKVMMAYEDKLSDQQIRDLIKFMKSF
jgi:formylglycine-generating enzyme required for sulfatase activity